MPQEYLEISLDLHPPLHESVSSYLIEMGASGTWIEGEKIMAFFDHASISQEQIEKNLASFFLKFKEEGLEVSSGKVVCRRIFQKDWNTEWKKFFKPIQITSRLIISPPWESISLKSQEERIIFIDPGLGFGTGTHPTTRNCLIYLDHFIQENTPPSRLKVFDLGSGSGILAIAAARLGAGYIVAADKDREAMDSMRHNFILNQVHRQIRLRLGSIFQADRTSYHLIMANLTAEDLILLSHELKGALLSGGTLILSGILCEMKGKVDKTMFDLGLERLEEKIEANWVTQRWKKGVERI